MSILVDPGRVSRRLVAFALLACVLVLAASCPNDNERPVAVMDCDHLAGTSPLEVAFDGTGSNDPDGLITRYEWDFGDSIAGEGQTASNTYTATTDTTYVATLTVTDDEGASDSDERQIVVWTRNPTPAPIPPAPCNCTGPDLDCSNFSSHAKAQACYDYCKGQGQGDVFRLDADNDGNACESLP